MGSRIWLLCVVLSEQDTLSIKVDHLCESFANPIVLVWSREEARMSQEKANNNVLTNENKPQLLPLDGKVEPLGELDQ